MSRADLTQRILAALKARPAWSKFDLSKEVGANRQTLNKVLAGMHELGLVYVEERGPREHIVRSWPTTPQSGPTAEHAIDRLYFRITCFAAEFALAREAGDFENTTELHELGEAYSALAKAADRARRAEQDVREGRRSPRRQGAEA